MDTDSEKQKGSYKMPTKKGILSSRNKKYWIKKGYTESEAIILARSRMPGTIEYYNIFKGFDIETSKLKSKEFRSNSAVTLKNCIRKYGEIDGEKKFNDYREKQALSNTFEYKRDKYGWTREQFDEYNKSRGNVGEKNGNYGSSYYAVWVEKYGKETADKMNEECSRLKVVYLKSDDHRRIMRISSIKRIEKVKMNGGQMFPGYNRQSIPIIEQYGKEHGYNFQHAENGGEFRIPELGYWVDGYDKENNIVIEYYEDRHKETETRDTRRIIEIINTLGCDLHIIKEWDNNVEIIKYEDNKNK